MGASGHVLGEKRTAWLSRKTGMNIAHALRGYSSNNYNVRVRTDECRHYVIDDRTFEVISGPTLCHGKGWSSCADWYDKERKR